MSNGKWKKKKLKVVENHCKQTAVGCSIKFKVIKKVLKK